MLQHKNILIVHNGALGDFLCAWPGIYAIVRHLQQEGQAYKLWFAGRESSLHWLKPLGFSKAPQELKSLLDNLYVETTWPKELADTKVFWFALNTPVCKAQHSNLVNLPILDFKHLQPDIIPRNYPAVIQNLFSLLKQEGVAFQPDFKEAWQEFFGKWAGKNCHNQTFEFDCGVQKKSLGFLSAEFSADLPGDLGGPFAPVGPVGFSADCLGQVGLIPGAGHIAKQWSMDNFELLAKMLDDAGYDPVYLLGPVEQERNILPQKARAEYPSPPPVLAERMLSMRAVIACDAGPAHLAAMHGVPGVVLFGPTCAQTWAPAGLNLVQAEVNNPELFAPIVHDPKEIDSSLPSSINLITPEQVMKAFLKTIKLT